MRKNSFDKPADDGFSVGLPIGLIAFCMLGISIYLAILGVEVGPPSTSVYLASDAHQ